VVAIDDRSIIEEQNSAYVEGLMADQRKVEEEELQKAFEIIAKKEREQERERWDNSAPRLSPPATIIQFRSRYEFKKAF
jgi:hypothetical protein